MRIKLQKRAIAVSVRFSYSPEEKEIMSLRSCGLVPSLPRAKPWGKFIVFETFASLIMS